MSKYKLSLIQLELPFKELWFCFWNCDHHFTKLPKPHRKIAIYSTWYDGPIFSLHLYFYEYSCYFDDPPASTKVLDIHSPHLMLKYTIIPKNANLKSIFKG